MHKLIQCQRHRGPWSEPHHRAGAQMPLLTVRSPTLPYWPYHEPEHLMLQVEHWLSR